MAARIDEDSLKQTWRALSGSGVGDGWRTIPLQLNASSSLMAGRRFPGDEEALIAGFSGIKLPPASYLPQGQGFRVVGLPSGALPTTHIWIALCRQPAGTLDMFAMMAADVARLLEDSAKLPDERIFLLFLGRIRAWQNFMEKGRTGLLSEEAEVGLFGELVVLKDIIDGGMHPSDALDAWQGPLDGLQDFFIGAGAIEVKATLSPQGFPAKISSLDQLDETQRQPLFLAGVRLALGLGQTLTEFAAELREALKGDVAASATFESRLMQAGFLSIHADKYVRQFTVAGTVCKVIEGEFPRLTRTNVAVGVTNARYEIDVATPGFEDIGLDQALTQLGIR
jgi:Putative  PD-(D/E)XK family member, (DUF4420)